MGHRPPPPEDIIALRAANVVLELKALVSVYGVYGFTPTITILGFDYALREVEAHGRQSIFLILRNMPGQPHNTVDLYCTVDQAEMALGLLRTKLEELKERYRL